MKIKFQIKITKDFKLQYSIINKENKETILTKEINPTIKFNRNTIDISTEDQNSIHFIQKWIENPEDFNTYSIEFQNKTSYN